MEVAEGTHYNPYFIAGKRSPWPSRFRTARSPMTMVRPQTVDQYSRDVSAFLMWAAEPHLEERKQTGFMVMVFLVLFAGLVYADQEVRVYANKPTERLRQTRIVKGATAPLFFAFQTVTTSAASPVPKGRCANQRQGNCGQAPAAQPANSP
jgi:hypothetical protein